MKAERKFVLILFVRFSVNQIQTSLLIYRIFKFQGVIYTLLCIGKNWCLQSHMVTHTGQKDHVCETCGSGFSRKDELNRHIARIHTHSGNYMCSYCDFRTVQQRSLDIHVNAIHTKAIKYSCEECNFSCYTKGNLTAHTKTVHLKLKPHKCPICPEAYFRRSELEKHISGHQK